ncbi:GNAT family N-acetyltransferase [Georgenia subflava]|uniref:GNAT family N-acetyltransferase n=1 Tax=Georgenia subflava TaxID=1622177 RepID=A0A6N7EJR7_9MICO|nr:GNAT family N-acetyltransferase [Georgenia subflava]MPV36436.1 GNAT family N-acetyltransferase [Georgenia subflava]
METTVRQGTGRYEIAADGKVVGVALYLDDGGRRIFFHTEVADAYEGQGLAGKLVRQALEETRTQGLRVVPVCPYVKGYVERHHEYDDIVDPVTDEAVQLVREHQAAAR